MTRLFYDCPIKALYMMKEFGVKFDIDSSEFILNMKATGLLLAAGKFEENSMTAFCKAIFSRDSIKIAVLPESEKIFEPKEGDWGTDNHGVFDRLLNKWFYQEEEVISDNITIIMRDQKLFFSPLQETSN